MADLSLRIPGKTPESGIGMEYFWMNASGFLADPPSYRRFATYETGAVVGKTLLKLERDGHEGPVFAKIGENEYINAIGLSSPGMVKFRDEQAEYYPLMRNGKKVPFILSVASEESAEEVEEVVRYVGGLFDAVEVNVSCPNVKRGMQAGQDPELTREYAAAARRATDKPVMVKLTPQVGNMAEIALAAVEGGANAITAINTVPGMVIDYRTGLAALRNVYGGVSGAVIKPVALARVNQVYNALKGRAKIIGVGGISDPVDMLEFVRAGADGVQMGTELFYGKPMELGNCTRRNNLKGVVKLVKIRTEELGALSDIRGRVSHG